MSLAEADRCMRASAPRAAAVHLLRDSEQGHFFLANGSQLYDARVELLESFEEAIASGEPGAMAALLRQMNLDFPERIADTPLAPPPIHALSLAIAQKCNLGCTYCYAQQGEFGGASKNMSFEVAAQAVDMLVDRAEPGAKLSLAFLGGEPLINRSVLQTVTQRAEERAAKRGIPISFSITTNGTLIAPSDAEFFEEHGFAVTISMDGPREAHNALRPYKGGGGSFDAIMDRLQPLLGRQRRMQVSARVTVTPRNLELRRTLEELITAGFHSVGFSPMLSAPNGSGEMQLEDLRIMLAAMIDCGREFERRSLARERYPFANLTNALREIDRGTHRPYPCGAGAGYLGVSADGALSACHRFVGDEAGAMGSLKEGVDVVRQAAWLAERHVHHQEPCRSCWARYLCGGGCHHEVIRRGRPACDYIRGWLHYCLEAYLRLSDAGALPRQPGTPPGEGNAAWRMSA